MNIGVIGTGYVGLVTGCCLAETGNEVRCMDIDAQKVARMRAGEVPIYEPGLERIFNKNIEQGRLTFTTSLEEVACAADVLFLALPTPQGEDGFADLRYVLDVSEKLGKYITKYKIIVDKSTVPVGTSVQVREKLALYASADFDVVSNPEFLREGYAVEDFLKPDRIVVGTTSERARKIFTELYAPYVRQGNPILFMDEKSAELSKYAANAFLATKISFMNEIACLCERTGADVDMVRRAMGEDERIGKRFLFAGIGYGGSCFPKDVSAIVKTAQEYGYTFEIVSAVQRVNKQQKTYFFERIKKYFKNDLKGKTIALWGLAFKPNTDDIRDAPSLFFIDELLASGAQVRAYDPEAAAHVRARYGDKITIVGDMYEVLDGADALLIVTEWHEFRTPQWTRMSGRLRHRVIFDGRNIFPVDTPPQYGYHYESVGRKTK